MNTGDQATATISLVATGGTALMGTGTPVLQSVTLDALDQNGNPVIEQSNGLGPLSAAIENACTAGALPVVQDCQGASQYSGPQFTVSGNWVLNWVYGPCAGNTGTLTVNVVNPSGSSSDNTSVSDTSGGGFGTQQYPIGGTFSLGIASSCPWLVEIDSAG